MAAVLAARIKRPGRGTHESPQPRRATRVPGSVYGGGVRRRADFCDCAGASEPVRDSLLRAVAGIHRVAAWVHIAAAR